MGVRVAGNPLGAYCAAASLSMWSAGCQQVLGPIEVETAPERETLPIGVSPGACADAGLGAVCPSAPCPPLEHWCEGSVLHQCDSSGRASTLVDECASAALCDAAGGACLPPACSAGEHRCSDAGELLACNADQTGFEQIALCSSPAFCSSSSGKEGCESAACRAGRQRCNGPRIEECRPDRSGFDPVGIECESAALCIEGESPLARCLPPICRAGQFRCDGELLERCADELNGFVFVRECATPALCNAGMARCDEPVCRAGERRCEGSARQVCNADRTAYVTELQCAPPTTCDVGAADCVEAQPPVVSDPSPVPPPPTPGTDSAPYTFVASTRAAVLGLGPLSLERPAQWLDVDTSAWTSADGRTLGPRFVASIDAARFQSAFDIPGVAFVATAEPPVTVAAMHARFDLTGRCTRGATSAYDDGLYAGTSQTWTNCGAANATTVVVAAAPDDATFVTAVIVSILGERDRVAMQRIWDTFLVQER